MRKALQQATRSAPVYEVLRMWPFLCIAALLGFTFRLYDDQFFWLDDFTNLSWVQLLRAEQMLSHVLNPFSEYFRPAGMVFYWLLLRCCDLDPAPYHGVAWVIHTINVGLVFLLLHETLKSVYPAAVGAAFFAFQAVFHDIYWSFGTIFELVCTASFLGALYLHLKSRPSFNRSIGLIAAFVLAYKAKEMAITLPLVLLLQETLLVRNSSPSEGIRGRTGKDILFLFLMAGAFAAAKLSEVTAFGVDAPYYMDISPMRLVDGYEWYLHKLMGNYTDSPWLFLCLLLVPISVRLARPKAIFFLLYVLITLGPVLPLVNHRFAFYWYLPMFGVAGLAALLALTIERVIAARLPDTTARVLVLILFSLLCRQHYFLQKRWTSDARSWGAAISHEYRAFLHGLRSLPSPAENETLYFDSMPQHFNEDHLLASVQVAFRRTDIAVKLVTEFPAGARYRLAFNSGQLFWIRTP